MLVVARAQGPRAPPFVDPPGDGHHLPEATQLPQLVQKHHPAFRDLRAEAGRPLPGFVHEECEACLKCGQLDEGFLRLRCDRCHAEKLVAFSCKKRGFCPSCGARRAAHGRDRGAAGRWGLQVRPLRQWVLSLPHAPRFSLATNPAALSPVLGVVYRVIPGYLLKSVGLTRATGHTGTVTRIQRFGSAPNLNVHVQMLFVDGVHRGDGLTVELVADQLVSGIRFRAPIIEECEYARSAGHPGRAMTAG